MGGSAVLARSVRKIPVCRCDGMTQVDRFPCDLTHGDRYTTSLGLKTDLLNGNLSRGTVRRRFDERGRPLLHPGGY